VKRVRPCPLARQFAAADDSAVADYCLEMPQRCAVILLSQHPVDMHVLRRLSQTLRHFGALL